VRNEALSRARKLANRERIERRTIRSEPVESQDDRVAAGDLIERALRALGERQREAIRLSFDEDLPYREIALRLDEPVGTIKSRLSNAVRALRAQLLAQGELP
jgi:RNA polymerase sigma-70 factor (ECF subfamily)